MVCRHEDERKKEVRPLILEAEGWDKCTEPFNCYWCAKPIHLFDIYWWAVISHDGVPSDGWRVCAACAMVGPPLEEVMP